MFYENSNAGVSALLDRVRGIDEGFVIENWVNENPIDDNNLYANFSAPFTSIYGNDAEFIISAIFTADFEIENPSDDGFLKCEQR